MRGNLAYRMQSMPGAINIPWEQFEGMIDGNYPFQKDRPILLICPIGEKTSYYAGYLQNRGYKAFSLTGGIVEWRNAGNRMAKAG